MVAGKRGESRFGELFGQAVVGGLAGVLAAGWAQMPAQAGLILGALAPLLWDLRRRPWKHCPRCRGNTLARAGVTYGVKRECWRCHNQRYPRIWSRPLIALGWRPRGHPDR